MSFPRGGPGETTPLLRPNVTTRRFDLKQLLLRRIPILAWLPVYSWGKLLQDTLAGLTVGLTAIPQGIAYAVVAGLPAQYGLYSSFMGCFVYLVFGSSKDVTVGPTAIMALLSQQHVIRLGEDLAVLMCFLSGCVITVMGLLHLGFLVDFISMPVICGFSNAAAIIIATSQLGTLFGIGGRADSFVGSIMKVVDHIKEIKLWDTVLGVLSMILLVCLKKLPGNKRGNAFEKFMWIVSLGRNAVVVVLGIALAYGLSCHGIRPFKITGNITEGLPPFGPPPFSVTSGNRTYYFTDLIKELESSIISVPLIAILESIAIAKAFAKKKTLDANQEMLALGLCNIFGSFVKSMPTTGSFTRTAVNNASGVKTPMGGLITGCLVLLACGLLTSTFEYIPKATLAAVIIIAMYYMLEINIFRVVWRTKKIDLVPLMVTLLSCLAIGLEYGMIAGIAVNLILLLYFAARPGLLIEERVVDGFTILFVSPKQSLSFPAAEYLREQVMSWCDRRTDAIPVVVEGRHVLRIDATVAKNLSLLLSNLEARDQKLVFWNWCEDARRTLLSYDSSLAMSFRTSGSIGQIFSEKCRYYPVIHGRKPGTSTISSTTERPTVPMLGSAFSGSTLELLEHGCPKDRPRRGVSIGGTGALGGHRSGHRLPAAPDRPDYGEIGAEDYAGLKGSFDDHIGLLVRGEDGSQKAAVQPDPRGLPSLPPSLEARLPQLDQSLRITHAEWLPVTNTRFKFFVYSAYYDDRVGGSASGVKGQGMVRVVSATKTRGPERVWCRLWYRSQNGGNITASVTVAAKVKVIRENWNLKYSACFVICPLPKEPIAADKVPETVSIVARLKASPTNRILIQNRPEDRTVDKEPLAVCVKPLHYDYNRVLQLVEFIELHRLLGATHVTLYNDTIGSEASCALKYYEAKGIVTILPWHHLDMISQREIRTEALFAALNDCLYRSMYKYEYVALVDLDEFIIPRHNDTIIELIRWMGSRINTKSTGAYSFQNAFFYLQWADDPFVVTSRTPTEAGLITLRKTRRRTKLHPHKQRSKYVCKPQDVVEAGNHFVWEFIPGHGTLNVPSDSAILHHYRVCEFGGNDCIKTQSVVDRTAYKYKDRLAESVDRTWTDLSNECSLPELEPVPVMTPRIKSSPALKSVR
ncbi:hypothetical protein KM043_017154 [Ampulex compressa]|nr:hypothetical protein KM043_017154 [Ampulex compressa]